ncbi:MAG: RagB/SusD family nutrient uptake outer membrane protein [Sphingobacteriales bacterium]|nr:RagB/SusD family nutrient uptake outer membrane protein [Sphingobacteriales bacterium]
MKNIIIIAAVILGINSGCRKFTDPGQPETQLTSHTVFASDATATAAQLAIYAQMEGNGFFYELSTATGLSADELVNYMSFTDRIDLYNNNLRPENTNVSGLWNRMYELIYKANAVYEGLGRSEALSAAVKNQISGESLFVRAFLHFCLLQLFGDIPVITGTDYVQNAGAVRQNKEIVFDQIERDLLLSAELLSGSYVNAANASTSERTRPNKYAVRALLARVYLYQGKWSSAEAAASEVIASNSMYTLCTDLNKVFLKNSTESIWQLQATVPGFNSYAGALYPFSSMPSNISLSQVLLGSFESGDRRLQSWVKTITAGGNNYSYAYKYKAGQNTGAITEYTMVIRLAELYLIRAEARAQQSLLTSAAADLNILRGRANLPPVPATTLQELLSEVERQRRSELFTEAGDRWTDLRRTGRLDSIMGSVKGANWSGTDRLYPIPQTEIDRNSQMTQNPGY